MPATVPVTVVRPKRTTRELWARFLGYLMSPFWKALMVMWLTPLVVSNWHPSYWKCLAFVLILMTLSNDGYRVADYWTKAAD